MSLEKGGSPGGNTKSRSQNNVFGPAKLRAHSFRGEGGEGEGGGKRTLKALPWPVSSC